VSGLDEKIAPGEQGLLRGISQAAQGWRLSQDPRTFAVAGAPFGSLVRSADTRVVLARGEHDSMVSTEELRSHSKLAREVAGAGHNAHVEQPHEIVGLLEAILHD
jgi:pimeloyl-ACP methyl ester carboxylesterase